MVATTALETLLPDSPLRRPVANVLAAGLSVLDLVASGRERQRWLGPVYLMKVAGGHAGIPRQSTRVRRWPCRQAGAPTSDWMRLGPSPAEGIVDHDRRLGLGIDQRQNTRRAVGRLPLYRIEPAVGVCPGETADPPPRSRRRGIRGRCRVGLGQ
ncbi:hypothetical protein [Mobilicoccus massiliensis]|uniref:hypothetical protein n=1 Tax=Mobilicoccus massiliensis TaxID=1522310 RepID=UPI00058E0D8E|nr:hypothetical protein [Mobilicoccus massiliensis]